LYSLLSPLFTFLLHTISLPSRKCPHCHPPPHFSLLQTYSYFLCPGGFAGLLAPAWGLEHSFRSVLFVALHVARMAAFPSTLVFPKRPGNIIYSPRFTRPGLLKHLDEPCFNLYSHPWHCVQPCSSCPQETPRLCEARYCS
jgi:hypothetical protein